MNLSLHDCPDHPGCTIIRSDGPADDVHIRGDVLPFLNQSYPHYDYRGGKDGSTEVWGVAPAPTSEMVLKERVDTNLVRLRDGIASFDTDTVAQRWATVKVALRVLLALARLYRQRTETDG